jgi:hypothetical protein
MEAKMAKRKKMTVQEWWPVRWGTKHEEADASNLISGWFDDDGFCCDRLTEDFSRALDRTGWKIVNQHDPALKWPLDGDYGPVPAWADDYNPKPKPAQVIPFPIVTPLTDGGKKDDEGGEL